MFKMGIFCLGHISSRSSEWVQMYAHNHTFKIIFLIMNVYGDFNSIFSTDFIWVIDCGIIIFNMYNNIQQYSSIQYLFNCFQLFVVRKMPFSPK